MWHADPYPLRVGPWNADPHVVRADPFFMVTEEHRSRLASRRHLGLLNALPLERRYVYEAIDTKCLVEASTTFSRRVHIGSTASPPARI